MEDVKFKTPKQLLPALFRMGAFKPDPVLDKIAVIEDKMELMRKLSADEDLFRKLVYGLEIPGVPCLVRLRLSVWLEMNDVGLHPVKPGFIIPSQKTLKHSVDLFALLTRMYPKCVKTEDKVERFVNDLLVSSKHVPMPPELALLDCFQMVEFLSQNLRSFPTHPDLNSLSTDAFLTYLNDHGAFDPDPRFDQCCVFRNKKLLMEKLRELKVRFEDFSLCKPKDIKVLEWCRLHWWLNEVVLNDDERLTGIKVQDLMSREESHWVGIVSDIRASRPQKRIRH